MLKSKHTSQQRIADKLDDVIKDAEIRAQYDALSNMQLLAVLVSTNAPKKEILQYLQNKYHLGRKQIENIVYSRPNSQ